MVGPALVHSHALTVDFINDDFVDGPDVAEDIEARALIGVCAVAVWSFHQRFRTLTGRCQWNR